MGIMSSKEHHSVTLYSKENALTKAWVTPWVLHEWAPLFCGPCSCSSFSACSSCFTISEFLHKCFCPLGQRPNDTRHKTQDLFCNGLNCVILKVYHLVSVNPYIHSHSRSPIRWFTPVHVISGISEHLDPLSKKHPPIIHYIPKTLFSLFITTIFQLKLNQSLFLVYQNSTHNNNPSITVYFTLHGMRLLKLIWAIFLVHIITRFISIIWDFDIVRFHDLNI